MLGTGVKFKGYSLSFNDFTTAGLTQTFTLTTLAQGSFIFYIRVKHSVAFAGPSVTAMKVRVGKSGGTTNFFANDFDVFQAVADSTLLEVMTPPMGQLSAATITATFTAVGANVNVCTAGIVQIDICAAAVTTPTATSQYSSTNVL